MITTLIESISIALHQEFKEKEYEIHMEEIKQDLKEPCFFIMCLNPTHKLVLGKRYFRKNQFVIQYFPESKQNKKRECHSVAERMTWCLEHLSVIGETIPIRGTKMHYEIVDDVLQFFVNYDCFIYKVESKETMETMESNVILE